MSGHGRGNIFRILAASCALAALARPCLTLDLREIDAFPVPVTTVKMVFSPGPGVLVLQTSSREIVVMDVARREWLTRVSNTKFTDIDLSPDGGYAFAADPGPVNYVHRADLYAWSWDVRTAYVAGKVQAVSGAQILLKSLGTVSVDTNNAWGDGPALTILNAPAAPGFPGFEPDSDDGDFRYVPATARVLHGNSGSSSQEIVALRIVNNNFVRQERSGIYGSAQGYGGTVVLATDGSAFYYGQLQVDPLDVTHNLRVFPEKIYAASGRIALGNGSAYDARTGELLAQLPFRTTVYAMNAEGEDFWAYDPATTTVHRFVPAASFYTVTPCRLVDTRDAPGAFGGPALADSSSRRFVLTDRCGVPAGALALAVNLAVTESTAGPGFLTVYPADVPRPLASSINYGSGQTRSNNALVPLGVRGDVAVFCGQGGGTAQVVIDVTGYYQ